MMRMTEELKPISSNLRNFLFIKRTSSIPYNAKSGLSNPVNLWRMPANKDQMLLTNYIPQTIIFWTVTEAKHDFFSFFPLTRFCALFSNKVQVLGRYSGLRASHIIIQHYQISIIFNNRFVLIKRHMVHVTKVISMFLTPGRVTRDTLLEIASNFRSTSQMHAVKESRVRGCECRGWWIDEQQQQQE